MCAAPAVALMAQPIKPRAPAPVIKTCFPSTLPAKRMAPAMVAAAQLSIAATGSEITSGTFTIMLLGRSSVYSAKPPCQLQPGWCCSCPYLNKSLAFCGRPSRALGSSGELAKTAQVMRSPLTSRCPSSSSLAASGPKASILPHTSWPSMVGFFPAAPPCRSSGRSGKA